MDIRVKNNNCNENTKKKYTIALSSHQFQIFLTRILLSHKLRYGCSFHSVYLSFSLSLHFSFTNVVSSSSNKCTRNNGFWLFLTTENKTNSKLSADANRILFVWFYNCLYVLLAQSFRSKLLYMLKLKHLSDLMVLFVLVIIIFILLFVYQMFFTLLLESFTAIYHISIWNFSMEFGGWQNKTKKKKKKPKLIDNVNEKKHISKFECAQLVGISAHFLFFFGVGVNYQCINESSKMRNFHSHFGYLVLCHLLNFVVLRSCIVLAVIHSKNSKIPFQTSILLMSI